MVQDGFSTQAYHQVRPGVQGRRGGEPGCTGGSFRGIPSQQWCENNNIVASLQRGGGTAMLMRMLISDKTEERKWLGREWERTQRVITARLLKSFNNG